MIIILPMVLYEWETWSLILRNKQKRRVFESRLLRRIFGPIKDEVAGGWRNLDNEELHEEWCLLGCYAVKASNLTRNCMICTLHQE
jgi:hypothetical protein